MPEQQVLSVAVFDLVPGREQECLQVLRELYGLLRRKNYSQDMLFRDPKSARRYINVRLWNSESVRHEAAEDPEVHRYWVRLPELLEMHAVYERLDSVPGFASQPGQEVQP